MIPRTKKKIVATANAQNLYLAINVFSQYFLKMYYFFHLCTITDVFNSNMILSNKAPAKNKAGKSALSPKNVAVQQESKTKTTLPQTLHQLWWRRWKSNQAMSRFRSRVGL